MSDRLIVRKDGELIQEFPLQGNMVLIGRDDRCDLRLDDGSVSGEHASISCHQGQYSVKDMGGKNGTLLNGTAIVERTVLQDKDQVGISGFTLTFHKAQPTIFMAPGQTPESAAAAVAPAPAAPAPAAPAAGGDANATIIAPAGGAGATVIMPPGSSPTALIDPSQAVPYTLMCTAGPLQGQMFNYPGGEITLGREPGNTLVLSDHLVSRHHAKVTVQDRKVMLIDLQAGNGTFVNGQRVTMHPLNHGETITIGSSSFQFQLQGAAAAGAAPAGAKKSPVGLLVGVAVIAAVVVGAVVTKDKWMGGGDPAGLGPDVVQGSGDKPNEGETPKTPDAGKQAEIDKAVAAALAEKEAAAKAAAEKLAAETAAAEKAAAEAAAAAKAEADKVAMAAKEAAEKAAAEKAAKEAEAAKMAAANAEAAKAAAEKAAAEKAAMEAAAAAAAEAAKTAAAETPAATGGDFPDVNADFDAAKGITVEGGLERAKLAE